MISCTKCGAQIPEDSKFCQECGARITPAPQPTPDPFSPQSAGAEPVTVEAGDATGQAPEPINPPVGQRAPEEVSADTVREEAPEEKMPPISTVAEPPVEASGLENVVEKESVPVEAAGMAEQMQEPDGTTATGEQPDPAERFASDAVASAGEEAQTEETEPVSTPKGPSVERPYTKYIIATGSLRPPREEISLQEAEASNAPDEQTIPKEQNPVSNMDAREEDQAAQEAPVSTMPQPPVESPSLKYTVEEELEPMEGAGATEPELESREEAPAPIQAPEAVESPGEQVIREGGLVEGTDISAQEESQAGVAAPVSTITEPSVESPGLEYTVDQEPTPMDAEQPVEPLYTPQEATVSSQEHSAQNAGPIPPQQHIPPQQEGSGFPPPGYDPQQPPYGQGMPPQNGPYPAGQPDPNWNPQAYPQQGYAPGAEPPPLKKKSGAGKVILIVLLALVLVAGAVFAGVQLFPSSRGGAQSVAYLTTDGTLRYYNPSFERPVTITTIPGLRSSSYYYVPTQSTPDGKYLLYLLEDGYGESGDLYLRNIDKVEPDNQDKAEKGIRLATGVQYGFRLSPDGKYVVYVRDNGDLYYHDFRDSYRLDSDVANYYIQITEDNRILYRKDEGGRDTYSLYASVIGEEGSKVKITDGIGMYTGYAYLSEDGSKVLYTKLSDNSEYDPYSYYGQSWDVDLYVYDFDSGEEARLLTEISSPYNWSDSFDKILYTKTSAVSYDRLAAMGIEDDMYDQDQIELVQPETSDYQTEEEGLFGTRQVLDRDAYNEAMEEYAQEYWARSRRQDLRDSISGGYMSYGSDSLEDLYLYENGTETLIAAGLLDYYSMVHHADMERGILFYSQYDVAQEQGEKLKISSWDPSYEDMYSFMERAEKAATGDLNHFYVNLDGDREPQLYYTSQGDRSSNSYSYSYYNELPFVVIEDGKSVAFIDRAPGREWGDLYQVTIGSGGVSDPEKIDDDVYSMRSDQEGRLAYFKDVRNNTGDLYLLENGSKEKVAGEASAFNLVLYEDGSFLFYRDRNENRYIGDLYLFNRDLLRVSSDVGEYYYQNAQSIYLIRNYNVNSNRGDLYHYNGDTLTLVEYDVAQIVEY